MEAPQRACFREVVEEAKAHLPGPAIRQWWLGAPAMARRRRSRVSVFGGNREEERSREGEESEGEGRGARPGSYPLAGRLGEDARRRERPGAAMASVGGTGGGRRPCWFSTEPPGSLVSFCKQVLLPFIFCFSLISFQYLI